jgi:menaquinone-dependent protoporphyrinogen IX oxidase
MIVSKARLPLLMITTLVLLSASAGQTAPACKHVLRHLTQTEINATLDDLAELRMELDLEKANGQVKTTSKALERDYQEKQNQILTAMDMNLETLQKELQQRIQTLQSET